MEACRSMLVERGISRPVTAPLELEADGRDPRNWINEQTENNKMQRTSRGQNGGSPLILVFDGRNVTSRRCHL